MYKYDVYLCDELYEQFDELDDAVRCAKAIKGAPYTWVSIFDAYGNRVWFWIF